MVRRQVATGLSALLIASGTALIADHELGTTQPAIVLGGAALPAEVAATEALPVSAAPAPTSASTSIPDRSGTPVELVIPFASSNHPDGVSAEITANPLNPGGSLFVPPDPRVLSWANEDAAPGSGRGTVIITGHVNYVIGGKLVRGALSDVAEYGVNNIGQTFTVVLADQRRLTYQISAAAEYDKDELAARPELRRSLYDQGSDFGQPGAARSDRLLLVSCGGAFDNATGNYEDNIFLYALPVG